MELATIMLLASIAASIGGSKMKHDSREAALARQRRLTRDERARTNKLVAEGEKSQKETRNKFGKGKTQQDMVAQRKRLGTLLKEGTTDPNKVSSGIQGDRTAPRVVNAYKEKLLQAAAKESMKDAENQAAVMSFGKALQDLQPQMQRSAADTNLIGNLIRGSKGVYGMEMKEAQQSAYSPMGDLLMNLGSLGIGNALYDDTPKEKS